MNLQCVITDDEPIALEILEDYIKMVPGLSLLAKCKNAIEAMSVMQKNKVDILFIDIKMPGISGIELVKSLNSPPAIIFTTAFPNYAIDGFDLDAVDYLLKPISIDRFLKAVNKVFAKVNNSIDTNQEKSVSNFLFVKSGQGRVRINYADIYYIEALENYVRIYLKDKMIVSLSSMKNIEEALPSNLFLRIHRSYIVNLEKVESVQNNIFKLGNKNLGTGKSYRKAISEILKSHHF
jgi:DNA-binding LytR/AlgR family response regulator